MHHRSLAFIALSLFCFAACRDPLERTGTAVAAEGSGGAGGQGGAPGDLCAVALCQHEVDASTWCDVCLVDGACPEGHASPRAGCGESCAPFLGPGGTAVDVSCLDGLWCSRCSGECAPLPRDCDC